VFTDALPDQPGTADLGHRRKHKQADASDGFHEAHPIAGAAVTLRSRSGTRVALTFPYFREMRGRQACSWAPAGLPGRELDVDHAAVGGTGRASLLTSLGPHRQQGTHRHHEAEHDAREDERRHRGRRTGDPRQSQ
jgi:hypothetical protein